MSSVSIQESSLADGGLARLTASLRRSGRRWTGLAIVEAAALGIAVALAAFCGLQLAYAAFGRGASWLGLSGMPVPAWLAGWAPPPLGQHATLALGAGLLVFVAAALSAVIRRQGVPFFARLADRTFGMKERLSTALQLSGDAAGPLNPIERALLVDVEARSDAVDVRRLVPLRVPRAAMAALLLLVAAALIVWLGVVPDAREASGPATPQPLEASDRVELAADIRRVAALVEADAGERADSYLGAVARELQQLGEAIDADDSLSRDDISAALRRLLPYAQAAYERAGVSEAAPANLSRLIEAALREVNEPPSADGVPSAEVPLEPPAGDLQAGEQAAGPAEGGQPAGGLDDMLAALERGQELPPGLGSAPTPTAINPDAFNDNDYDQEVPGRVPRGADDPNAPQQVVGGARIGAAEDAGAGVGDAAGQGVQPLGDGVVTEFGAPPELAAEMTLEDADQGDGRRIRLDMAPEGENGGALPEGERADSAQWQRLPEQEVNRSLLSPQERDVVRQYFRALTQDGG